ncbi:MAG: DNA repair protein RadC [Candidatus Diapherotrites archaeon]|nr:DNA repair protein RadC [Candidatus Diapherotrites archaeon]
MKLQAWPPHLRPRERGKEEGFHVLSDAELLAILLRTGRKGKNAVELAHEVLRGCEGDLTRLQAGETDDLIQNGLGNVQAITVKAALELGTRMNTRHEIPRSRGDMEASIATRIRGLAHEVFYVIPLDRRDRALGNPVKISEGTRYAVMVEPRDVLRVAVQRNAARLVLMHNHPSQDASPSAQDLLLTKQILEGCAWIDVELADHLIVTREELFRMREEGLF